MREILFRGKDKDNNWVEGLLLFSSGTGVFSITHSDGWKPSYSDPDAGESTLYTPVNYETIGQYTGLTDKNGVKIFEGDIVKSRTWNVKHYKNGYTLIGVIEYNTRLGGYYGMRDGVDSFAVRIMKTDSSLEVIGNIHDNPELLTKPQK